MATTENLHTGDASKTKFSFTFPYIQEADVKVYLFVTDAWVLKTLTTHYTFANATTIQFGSAPAAADSDEQTALGDTNNIKIKRLTDSDSLSGTFYPGSAIRSSDLNDNFTQNLYVTQEANNNVTTATTDAAAAVVTADAAEATADAAVVTADAAEVTADAAVVTANTADDNADDAIRATDRLVATTDDDGSTWTLTGNNTNASTDPKGVGYAVTTAEAASSTANAASAAVGSKLPLWGGQMTGNITMSGTQTVDGRDLSVDGTKLDGVETAATADQTASEIKTLIASSPLGTSHLAANSVDSDQYVDESIDGVHIANDAIDSQHYAAGSIDNEHIADGAIDSAALDAATVITNSEQAAATVNDTSFLTSSASDARYFQQSSSETLKDGVAWVASDAYIATAAAIDDRVASLVNEVGGFVAIADESKFPTTNPDISDGTGTVVSITALTADRTASGSGVLTTGFTTTGSTAVTITGCTNDQVYKQGYGLLVETTSTLNTYTFVRYVAQTSDVISIAAITSDISDVAAIDSNVTTVAGIASNVTTVAGISTDVTTVAADGTDIGTVAGISANVTTVAGISGNVTTVAGVSADVTTCATNISDIQDADNQATAAASSATAAASSASAAATSATSAAGAVTALNTLSYYHDLGSIADTAGTTTDYGAIA